MKRFLCLFLAFSIMLSLCSCGDRAEQQNPDAQSSKAQEEGTPPLESESSADESSGLDSLGNIEMDQGLFDVTLTIPADFVDEGMTQEQLDQEAKGNGYKSATLNDDGSVSYVMTKAQHQKMMLEIKESIDSGLQEMVSTGDYPSITKIEANDDYTQYTVTLNAEEVGLSEGFAVMAFYVFSGMYHVFNGTELDNVNVKYVSASTGQVIEESNSSDMG